MIDLSYIKEVFLAPPQAHVNYLKLLNRHYQRAQRSDDKLEKGHEGQKLAASAATPSS